MVPKLEIFGERINSTRPSVAEALEERDRVFLQKEALDQARAGANVIDVHTGTFWHKEPEYVVWAIEAIQEVVDVPIAVDSLNPGVLATGLQACRKKEEAIANSITLERERVEEVLPLVREYGCKVVALTIDQEGRIPETAKGRLEIAQKLVAEVDRYGIPRHRLYLDALGMPIGVDTGQGLVVLESLKLMKAAFPDVKTIISTTAVSYGLPNRRLIHRSFLPMLLAFGLDAVVLDPLDKELMATVIACEALLDRDEFCQKYVRAHREGKLA
ncbi:5-methyltetrahydrofolate--homocysteine methyltransferase [Candidatus Hakubella thermalkaliphila]|uniref:5-methyltetrahydrofolate--homocysteine methyltransferase n=1 Tax=Candidatus Hakubella thermalkaliphila TaxID=2754717 RepID=A0A6V8PIE2_9ACTN|nr:5-methyltetrahydrofolate--homocysteine methyltransferase [Candidatus Hakubella thermalkaliphila]